MKLESFEPKTLQVQQFSVSYEYPVVFCAGALDPADAHLHWAIARREPQRPHPVVFCVDTGVLQAWPTVPSDVQAYCVARGLELRHTVIPVAGGEACKNDPKLVPDLIARFESARLDRQACVIAIGGGAVLDAVGYAASLVHRGIRVVRVPTTVLAQNDAGIGVKNGVNAFGAKNFLGTFAPPYAVVNDRNFLETLAPRDIRAGLAEAVKVACIRSRTFFEWLERNADDVQQPGTALDEAIRRCAALHLEHIRTNGDPFETGSARPLDYGHWAAHRLEIMTGHSLRHGEAVAIGMVVDARYAVDAGLLAASELERLLALIQRLGLPIFHTAATRLQDGRLQLLAGLQEFREHLGGRLTVTLLDAIGRAHEVNEMDEQLICAAVAWLTDRASTSPRLQDAAL